ncbi:MAG: EAL domain-containing protein [Chloracidobacterium sp.]|nr:EAL domain-containing protein [Chloracidobacterium sp.]
MERKLAYTTAKGIVILAGILSISIASANLAMGVFSWGFVFVVAFAVAAAPRMSLALPRSKFAISFADALIFLTFLLYGGPAAVIVAAAETFANCLYLRKKGFPFGPFMIPTNVSIATVSTALTILAWDAVNLAAFGHLDLQSTPALVAYLGFLALVQFATSSFMVALFQSLKDGSNVFTTWSKDCFSSSMTQIVGAGLAGLIFRLITFGDIITGGIATVALSIAYLSYRQTIREVNEAIDQAEEAEREKAWVERDLRREAERHASQLALSLEKEELANVALRKSEKDFQHAALHDSLTNLANRKQLGDILRTMIRDYKEDPSATFQVLFLDISRFKDINDSLGHTFGDKVLMVAAKRFVRMLAPTDVVARIGGDEFAIILRNVSTVGKAQKVARRIYDSISQPFSLSGNNILISVNVGIAPCDAEYNTPEEVLRDADIAMHYAKERNVGVAVFTKELRFRFIERVRYENDLREAIDRNELSMNYQPLVDLHDGDLLGFEALLRWNHSEFGNIPPNKFIPIAEDSGLIIPITIWILQQTCDQLAHWQKINPSYRDLIISVNISGKHLMHGDLIADVEHALEMSKIAPSSLKLEITESTAMENADHTINVLNRLKQLGVKLSIDDFGTGYSSLSILHRLPFDSLKIDRSFVYAVGENGENSEILQTIIALAKNLKMRVIAEGIETETQLHLLQNLGCDYGQGYLLARPQTAEKIDRALYECKKWLPVALNPEDESNAVREDHQISAF